MEFKFLHPLEVRYGDLDPQGHVNNAAYLTYFEQARVHYLVELGLFARDQSFADIGVIIADIHIRYSAPVHWGIPIQVGVRTASIGHKSVTLEQCVMHVVSQQMHATGTVILVAYDYPKHATIPVPQAWRARISQYEGL
jgi:acyl-CoA thioester hydrolase